MHAISRLLILHKDHPQPEAFGRDLADWLRERGVAIIEPGSGELASGLSGKGRMAEPEAIIEQIRPLLRSTQPDRK